MSVQWAAGARQSDRRVAPRGDHGRGVGTLQRAPIGLDIGVRRPEEIAISIAAEIIALQERRRGGRLTENDLPVHNARPPASTIS
jgi:xanthine dehydrogenase accessory factor